MSQATLARVRVPGVSSTLPGDSDSCPKTREVDHQSRATRTMGRWSAVSTSCPILLVPSSDNPRGPPALPSDSHPSPRAHGVHQHSRATRAPVNGPHCRPALPGDSGPCLWSCGLDHMSRSTWGRVPVPAGLTSSPGRLGPRSDGLRGRQALPGDSCAGPRAQGVDHFPQANRAWAECSRDRQISWATCAHVLGPAVSTSTPWRLVLRSEGPQG